MKKERWIVTEGIPGIASKDEIVVVNQRGILIGRWLPLSRYPELIKSRHLLRAPRPDPYRRPDRPPRCSREAR